MGAAILCLFLFLSHQGYSQKNDEAETAYMKAFEANMSYLKNHPDSLSSIDILNFYFSDLPYDSAVFYFNSIDKKFSAHETYKKIEQKVELAGITKPGTKIKNFNVGIHNGLEVNLDGIAKQNRLILIDFWGSWCVPCRRNSFYLKNLYTKYKDNGFSIVGVSTSETDINKWEEAIQEDGIDLWYQHIDSSKTIQNQLGIEYVPTYLLIDGNLKIVGRFNGRWKGLNDLGIFIDKFLASQ